MIFGRAELHLLTYVGLLNGRSRCVLHGGSLRSLGARCTLLLLDDRSILYGIGLLGCALARTTGLGLRLLRRRNLTEGVGVVEVNQLDDAHVGTVSQTETGLQDTGVTARTLRNLGRYRTEQLRYGILLLQVREDYTTRMRCVLLRLGYQRLHELLYSLSLGYVSMRLCRISDEAMFDSNALRWPAFLPR